MDRRRAPSLTYALIKPFGVSDTHWRFQNKLNKPTSEHDAIVYATGEPFELNEARAWWLCYDTLVMLDNELRKSNSVLIANGLHQFAIKQVAGVSDPQTLSRYIRVNGWKPVDAEIRVTNPIHLAKTLGGKNLYGNDFIAPVRELLQNAVDAVRARRLVSKRGSTWGSIRVRIERQGEETWLHIDDTGIGMSEATLTGALLDFGNSFWRTQAFRDEWPGLESSGLETIGKFGIGFFSIFLLGEHIKVVSRRYDAGKLDARLLEFESIGLRPLVRSPAESEMHEDYVTTVSVKIDEQKIRDENEFSFRPSNLPAKTTNLSEWLLKRVRHIMRLVSGVDVEILLETPSNNLLHAPNWTTIAPETFLTEVVPQNLGASFLAAYAPRLRILRDDNGVIYGRAALSVSGRPSYRIISPLSGISVGGFFVARGPEGLVGLLTGDTIDASRHSAKEKVPAEVLANWATEQAQLVTEDYFSLGERLYAAERVDMLGGDPKDLPFVFCGGDLVTRSQFVEIALREGEIHFLLDARYEDRLYWVNISNINIGMLSDNMLPNICAFGWKERDTSDTVFGNDKVNEQYLGDAPVEIALDLIDLGRSGTTVFELLERTWGGTVQATLQQLQIFASTHHFLPPERWVLSVKLENN
jgi:hypothetical protein